MELASLLRRDQPKQKGRWLTVTVRTQKLLSREGAGKLGFRGENFRTFTFRIGVVSSISTSWWMRDGWDIRVEWRGGLWVL